MPDVKKKKHPVWSIILAIITAGIFSVILDLVTAVFFKPLPVFLFFAVFFGLVIALFFVFRASKKLRIILPAAACAAVLAGLVLAVLWYSFSKNAVYESTDSGKSEFFAGRTVMVLCPHQDDDLNILGGVLEEFQNYESNVIVVFSTNGDFIDTATGLERLQEALNVADFYGLDENNVIFLGYGDGWLDDYPNIYNSGDEVVISHAWNSRTYGLDFHDAYASGTDYTGNNYRRDLYSVITEYMPDMIFTCDYDDHTDHRALSLIFDDVMGEILKDYDSYEPLVFKTLAYSLAYYNSEDFYALNIKSTVNPYGTDSMKERPDYLWSERVRIPVSAASLSRSLFSDSLYKAIKLYATQGAGKRGVSMVNGDRVYWQRDTSSVLYNANISVSSGDGNMLNNFMIIDSNDLADTDRMPYDSVWTPTDEEKEAEIQLQSKMYISRICLYDNPDPDNNVLNAEIVLDDGTVYETGPLNKYGTATEIPIDKENVSSFSIRLVDTEGTSAGLAEVEAFSDRSESDGAGLIKLQNMDGDFVYDYCIADSSEESFSLYTYGNTVKLDECEIICTNEKCTVSVSADGLLTVVCPKGETTYVTVTDSTGTMSDTVKFSHASALTVFCQRLESKIFPLMDALRSTVVFSLVRSVYYSL